MAPPGSTVWVDEVSNDFDSLIRVLSAAGDEVTSDDFDAMLYLAGPGLGDPLNNDDGGPGLGSRLEVRLPETGTYTVVVGALSEGVGGYQLYLLRPAGD